jgi:hypothetical protein
MFLYPFLVAGLLVGFLRGGSLRGLADLTLRYGWLVLLGLAIQVVVFGDLLPATALHGGLVRAIHLASYLLLLAGLALNLRVGALRVLGLGAFANALVIAANGGYMPVLPEAARAAGVLGRLEAAARQEVVTNAVLLDERTLLPFLGDVFAIPAGLPLANAFSIGDVFIGLGALLLIAQAMGKRANHSPAEAGAGAVTCGEKAR